MAETKQFWPQCLSSVLNSSLFQPQTEAKGLFSLAWPQSGVQGKRKCAFFVK